MKVRGKTLYAIGSKSEDSVYLILASSKARAWAFFAKECLDVSVAQAKRENTIDEAVTQEAR